MDSTNSNIKDEFPIEDDMVDNMIEIIKAIDEMMDILIEMMRESNIDQELQIQRNAIEENEYIPSDIEIEMIRKHN